MSSTHIIIVNYNAGSWLTRSVASALEHSHGAVTVVDNNSSDQSVTEAKSSLHNDRVEWILNTDNKGFAAANNQVLCQAQADFLVLLNPDCELSSGALEKILDAFEQQPKMGLASCRILNEDGSVQASCRRRFPTPWSALVRLLRLDRMFPRNPKFADFDYGDLSLACTVSDVEWVEAISGAFMVARRSALQEVGLLDEAYFMHCEDLDWCMRFSQQGWQVGFVPQATVTHAKGVSTQSRPIGVLWTLHKGMNRFFDKFYTDRYAWPLRYLVKVGIFASFVLRAVLSYLTRLFRS